MVDATWKLALNRDLSYAELYDLAEDPYEQVDLKEQNPETVDRLTKKVEAWQATLPAGPEGDVFSVERAEIRKEK